MHQSLSPANASERRDSDGGFSLVEIMVALAIFLVASAAVLGLIMLSLGTVRENSDRVSAATLARGQLDSLRGASYAERGPFRGSFGNDGGGDLAGGAGAAFAVSRR